MIVFDNPLINIMIKARGTKADLSNTTVLITCCPKRNGKITSIIATTNGRMWQNWNRTRHWEFTTLESAKETNKMSVFT